MMLTAESLARSLGGKRNGRGWRVRCPAHTDKDPSLDIDIGESGKVLLCCRAGCANDAVVDALKQRGLWANEKPAQVAQVSEPIDLPPHPQLGRPHQRWDYYDARGHFIGAVCRWDRPGGKEIRPASFDGAKWTW